MKGTFLFAATLATMAVLAEEPPVAVTAQTYDAAERTLTVTYSLSCETPMIVTFDVLDDSGASIGAERIRNAYGEINRLVEPGKGKTFVWRTVAMGGGFSALSCKVQVKAWSPDDPPEVMVLDLFKDSANKYARTYYPSLESLPGGLTENLEYKTTKLVMKHVHRPVGGKWIMGSFNECSASDRGNEGQHEVTIAADYWLGVFELTQYQAVRINDGSDLNTQGGAYWKDGLGGKYGIRHENCVLARPFDVAKEAPEATPCDQQEQGEFQCLDTLTLCYIDTSCVVKSLLAKEELAWLNQYNQWCYDTLAPHLDEADRTWLEAKCRAL